MILAIVSRSEDNFILDADNRNTTSNSRGLSLIINFLRRIFKKPVNFLKKWIGDYYSMYVLIGLTLINLSLYYLYYFLAPIFPVKELTFLYKLTGEEAFPPFGFCLSIIPPILSSHIVFLSARITQPSGKIILIFVAIIFALAFTLTFIPLSATIFAAYLSLAGITASISSFRSVIERLELPSVKNKGDRRVVLEMRHNLLTTILGYSVWAIITVVVAGLSALLFNPAVGKMIELGGLRWVFVQGQIILCISLIVYYSAGFIMGVTMNVFRKLLEVEKALEK